MLHAHIGEGFRREIDIRADLLQHGAGFRPGDVHAGVGGGHVGDIDIEPPLRVPEQHLAIDHIDAAGGRRHVEMLVMEAAGDAVIGDDAGIVGHQHIARAADRLLGVAEGVHAVEELRRIRPAHIETTQGRDVDQADILAHRLDFRIGSRWSRSAFVP